jgi:hypothetical protein
VRRRQTSRAESALSEADVRTLALWAGPEYLLAAARAHGKGDPVAGAEAAYAELRGLVLNYARFVGRSGPGAWRAVTSALRAWGFLARYQPLQPFQLGTWRRLALDLWPGPTPIPGEVLIRVGEAPQDHAERACLRAVCEMLREVHRLNVALLHGRLWQRTTSHVLLSVAIAPDELRQVVVDYAGLDHAQMRAETRRALRGALEAERHPLAHVGHQILAAWAKAGFIASPGGAMVSVARVPRGHAALVPSNGIPLAISIGRVHGGLLPLCLTPDHRVFDGEHAAQAYQFLEERIPRCL